MATVTASKMAIEADIKEISDARPAARVMALRSVTR
jgi:hypothetical protein